MRKLCSIVLGVGVALTLSLAAIDEAQAKRLGGGKSFGSKPSYSQSHQAPQRPAGPAQPQADKAPPAAQPGAAAPARTGMMGGLLGGLLMGGLLGALFFGGAFEGISFVDVLIIGLLAFVLYKLFAARRQPAAAAGGGYAAPDAPQRREARPFETDLLFDKAKGGSAAPRPAVLPEDFDAAAFLDGAKAAYGRLQQAWDQGDLADIRQFTTDKVFAEIQDQLRGRHGENRTEIVALQAELLEVVDAGAEREAAVLFQAELRERDEQAPLEPPAQTVREVWHFVRPINSRQPTWYLDGIQQVEH